MAVEECVSELFSFRNFFDEWKQELNPKTFTDSSGNEVLTMKFTEYEHNDLPFETFAAQEMGCDIVSELDTDCRLVS